MIFNRDFLRNFFVCALIFSYHGFVGDAYAVTSSAVFADSTEMGISGVTNTVIREQAQTSRFSSSNAATKVKLCPSGQYVAACGNYRVGFNWLKSAKVPDPDQDQTNPTSANIRIEYKETKNYYISNDILDLYDQMRIFFGNTTMTMEYLDNDDDVQITDNFQEDREAILNNLCHPSSTNITCMPCPNDASIPASTVQLDANNLTIQGSWEFHTFADCYMQEFEDSTGSYFYVPDNMYVFNDAHLNNSAKCYYQNTTAGAIDTLGGDEIGTFVMGLYMNQRNATERIYIPNTDIISY